MLAVELVPRELPVSMQPLAVPAEPSARLDRILCQRRYRGPEPVAVIADGEMRDLMCDDIVEHPFGSHDQPPAKRQIAVRRAGTPA